MRGASAWYYGIVAAALSLIAADVDAAATPQLSGALSRNAGKIGSQQRSFLLYLPKDFKPGSPLVIVFHGNSQDSNDMRITTGYRFDMLADQYGFAVVYPDGINRSWNTCHKSGQPVRRRPYDVGFIEAIIAHQAAVNQIDKKRVFVTGYSAGGAMAYRMALERPEMFAGIAAIASGMPAASDSICKAKNIPVPIMIINGTADPENPYNGGIGSARNAMTDSITISGMNREMASTMGGDGMRAGMDTARAGSLSILADARGPAMATEAIVQYWAKVNGQDGPPDIAHLPHRNADDPTSVEMRSWTASSKPPVVLYSIIGGGHLVPQPNFRYPNLVGRQTEDLDAPEVVWDFFSHQPSRP